MGEGTHFQESCWILVCNFTETLTPLLLISKNVGHILNWLLCRTLISRAELKGYTTLPDSVHWTKRRNDLKVQPFSIILFLE